VAAAKCKPEAKYCRRELDKAWKAPGGATRSLRAQPTLKPEQSPAFLKIWGLTAVSKYGKLCVVVVTVVRQTRLQNTGLYRTVTRRKPADGGLKHRKSTYARNG
jgi:hypothetical protein